MLQSEAHCGNYLLQGQKIILGLQVETRKMARLEIQTENPGTSRKNTSNVFRWTLNLCFFVIQACLLFSSYHVFVGRLPERQINTYSLAKSREHFANTISPYTNMRVVNRGVATKDYLNAMGLTKEEQSILRHFIKDYLTFHKNNRHNGTRRLVFSPAGTGIGDRFGCMLFAYWAAVVSKRVFLVDWNEPFPLKEFLAAADDDLEIFFDRFRDKPELIKHSSGSNVADSQHLNSEKGSLQRYGDVLRSDVHTVFMRTNRFPTDLSEKFVGSHCPKDINPRQMFNVFANYNFRRAVLHHVFRLSDNMVRDLDRVSTDMQLGPATKKALWFKGLSKETLFRAFGLKQRPYIAVHGRIGKGVGEAKGKARFEKISANMNVAAKCLASRAVRVSLMSGAPALPIFLATDTTEFRDLFKEVVQQMSHGRIKVVSGDWNVAHSTRLKRRLSENGTAVFVPDSIHTMWGTYIDLMMLGHGEHILALYSSFPRLALHLGNAETLTELRNEICLEEERWV